jgi:hypothetical protein
MAARVRETGILCPECEIPLVHLPEPLGPDLAVCPSCGLGGDYNEVVEQGGRIGKTKFSLDMIRDLLKQAGFTRK